MSVKIGNVDYIDCSECSKCKPRDALRNGVRWGICGMSGNIVYLEPWKERRIKGSGYIHHGVSSCGMYKVDPGK